MHDQWRTQKLIIPTDENFLEQTSHKVKSVFCCYSFWRLKVCGVL